MYTEKIEKDRKINRKESYKIVVLGHRRDSEASANPKRYLKPLVNNQSECYNYSQQGV